MSRLVLLVFALALGWVLWMHPAWLPVFVIGFSLGMTFMASTPAITAWGRALAGQTRDTEGNGGHGVRIPIHVDPPRDPVLDALDRHRQSTEEALGLSRTAPDPSIVWRGRSH